MAARPSLLDNLGEEVTGIVAPVSLCMAVTVLLVRLLNPEGSSSSSSVLIANIAYQEQATDSSGKKLGGALLNAIIFVAVIGGMTILLFLLFKYKCYKFIYAYMGFAVFNIFFFLTGALFIQVMQVIKLHIDAFSLAYGLLNFSVVGTMGLLFVPIPLLMKQLYLIWVGIIVAYIFTWIPEWTAWVILVLMALYDIAAVLIPGGPLKALVEMAIERKQDLPALVYEARPAGGRPYVRGFGNRGRPAPPQADGAAGGGPGGGGAAAPGAGVAPHAIAEGAATTTLAAAAAAAAAPGAMEMRRPMSQRGSRPASAGDAQRGGGSSGGGGGGTSGGSFGSHQGLDLVQLQSQSQTRRGAGGPRPVAEGREVGLGEAEAGAAPWALLPVEEPPQPPPQGGGRSGSVGADSLRERLSKVLSSPRREAGGGGAGAGASSGEWKEPLIQPPGSTSAEPQQALRISGTTLAAAASTSPGESGMPRATRTVSGGPSATASPGSRGGSYDPALAPAAAAHRGSGGSGGGGGGDKGGWEDPQLVKAHQLKQQGSGGGGGAGVSSSRREGSPNTMRVRAVAPALSQDVLAEAVRRTSRNMSDGGQHPPASSSPPVPPPPPPESGQDGERRRGDGQLAPTEGGGRGQEEAFEVDLPDAIKLGLGDFIFYSMLVGRAAMYDFMTVFSAYLAIIAGLGLTLLCLAIYQKALPALPFSIALGVAFYFLTRLTLEPFLVPMSTHLTYF